MAKILGIDPGLQITGWGIVDFDGYRLKHISHGTIASKSSECIEDRLSRIFTGLSNVIETSFPQEVSIERVFVNSNPISSLKLGMARGVAICVPGIFKLKVFEYMPNKVKKTVVGVGHASKDQIAMMVQKLLNLDCKTIKLDAADALAIAICHAHNRATYQVEQAVK